MSTYDQFILKPLHSVYDYTEMFCRILPKGLLWRLENFSLTFLMQDMIVTEEDQYNDSITSEDTYFDTVSGGGSAGDLFKRFLSCFASRLVEIEEKALYLFNCIDPYNCSESDLVEYEKMLDLPGVCLGNLSLTLLQRKLVASNKIFNSGQAFTKAFLEDFANDLGYDITVNEDILALSERRIGVARIGDEPRLGGLGGFSRFKITIHSGEYANAYLKCIFNSMKPAHSVIYWVEE